jgi:hypothetical protein
MWSDSGGSHWDHAQAKRLLPGIVPLVAVIHPFRSGSFL